MRSPIFKVTLSLGLGSDEVDISSMITTLTYKRSVRCTDIVDLTIDDTDDVDKLLSEPACVSGGTVTFSYGYIGERLTNPVSLTIGDIEVTYSGSTTMTLRSTDVSMKMKQVSSNRMWENSSLEDKAKYMAEVYGLTVNLQGVIYGKEAQAVKLNTEQSESSIDAETGEVETSYKSQSDTVSAGSRATYQKHNDTEPQAWMTDWDFMQMQVAMESNGYVMYMEGSTVHIVIKDYDAKSSDLVNIEDTTKNIKSIKFKYKEIKKTGSEAVINSKVLNPATEQRHILLGDYHISGTNGSVWVNEGGGKKQPVVNQTQIQDAIDKGLPATTKILMDVSVLPKNTPTILAEDAKRYAVGQPTFIPESMLSAQGLALVTANMDEENSKILTMILEEEGNVLRNINRVITVAGVADRYAGNWYIFEVVDNVSDQGFKTTSSSEKSAGKYGVIPTDAANNSVGSNEENKKTISADTGEVGDVTVNNNIQLNSEKQSQVFITSRDAE